MKTPEQYKINPSMIYRKIGEESVIVPIGQNVNEVRTIFSLNDTAAFILEQFKKTQNCDEVMQSVLNEFDSDNEEQTTKWVYDIISEFEHNNILLR